MFVNIIATGSTGNATIISDGKTALLLDAGIPFRKIQIAVGFVTSRIAGCLITHEHMDHSKAVGDLIRHGIDVYASGGTLSALEASSHRAHAVDALAAFAVGSFDIMPFDCVHDCAAPLGFLIQSRETGEKLIYFADTAYLKYTFPGITHIIGECNHGEAEILQSVRAGTIAAELAARIVRNHLSVERLADFLNAIDKRRLRQVYLIHLSDNNSNAERFRDVVQRITGAEVIIGAA